MYARLQIIIVCLLLLSTYGYSNDLSCKNSALRFQHLGSHSAFLDLYSKKSFLSVERYNVIDYHRLKTVRLDDGRIYKLGEFVGSGHFGVVYCFNSDCTQVIKIPKGSLKVFTLQQEVMIEFGFQKAGINSAKIIKHGRDYLYLIKKRVPGKTAKEIIANGHLSKLQTIALAEIFFRCRAFGLFLDINPANLVWDSSNERFVVIDNYYVGGYTTTDSWINVFFKNNEVGKKMFLAHLDDTDNSAQATLSKLFQILE
ncbi:MAG: serine/threonine protein kinase [Bacteriovoracaceae bacterium]|nr:serine/threonine protein kinase [Bacteriovoracaceae bacterium]